MEKYIRVTGKGQIAVKPDLIRLNLTLEDTREKNFVSEPMSRNMALMKSADMVAGSYQMNIQPDDIQVSDTVTIVWQIG